MNKNKKLDELLQIHTSYVKQHKNIDVYLCKNAHHMPLDEIQMHKRERDRLNKKILETEKEIKKLEVGGYNEQ